MKLNIDPDQLVRMAEKEANKIVSAGGWVAQVKNEESTIMANSSESHPYGTCSACGCDIHHHGGQPSDELCGQCHTSRMTASVSAKFAENSQQMKPTYQDGFVQHTDEVLEHLLGLNWLDVTEARLEYFMSDEPRSYTYGKPPHAREYHASVYTDPVQRIQDRLNAVLNANFNVCFLNRYNTQKHQLGWHADDSPTMDRNHPIAVVSFGAEREIWWKPKDENGIVPKDQRQLLGSGSLFVMPPGFQDSHLHRIPKADREVGVRVSLTFRRYVPEPVKS